MGGPARDATSNVARVEVRIDGGAWQNANVDGGTWAYAWSIPAADVPLAVRSIQTEIS